MRTLYASAAISMVLSASASTNSMPETAILMLSPPSPQTIHSTFARQMTLVGTRNHFDRFGPFAELRLVQFQGILGYGFARHINQEGEKVFEKALLDGARETAVWSLSTKDWSDRYAARERTSFGRFIDGVGKLLEGSVGNTAEEGRDLTSPIPTVAEDTLYARWQGISHVGYRLLNEHPYIYMENAWGWYEGERLLMSEVRCYSLLDNFDQVGIIKVEGLLSLRVSDTVRVTCGAAFYPTELNSDRWAPYGSLRLSGDRWYIGYSWGIYERIALVGWTRTF